MVARLGSILKKEKRTLMRCDALMPISTVAVTAHNCDEIQDQDVLLAILETIN